MSPSQNKSAMQDHIPQWQASSLTQVEYCKAHDIKPHIFSYYKKQFSSATSSVKQSSQLVPVKLVTEDTLIGSRLSAGLSVIKRTHSNGFWLYYRRLDKGKFKWPAELNEQTVSLSLRELHWLLDGLSYLQTEAHTVVSGLKNN